jgi:hypothetical protein
MERDHVGVGRHDEVRAQPVEQRMRHLVHRDVVRQAGEDIAARHGAFGRLFASREIAKTQLAGGDAVFIVGVLRLAVVRPEHQPGRRFAVAKVPAQVAAQRRLEGRIDVAADGKTIWW